MTGTCPPTYSISQEICTRFCCALLCCGYAIVHNEFTWSIYPYWSGLLCWHWGNRWICENQLIYNHNKAQQSKNRVHISWDILYTLIRYTYSYTILRKTVYLYWSQKKDHRSRYIPGPLHLQGWTLIPAWVSKHAPCKVWDEITHPFPNFDGCTVEVWGWIRNFTPHFIVEVITYPNWDSS